MVAEQLSQIVFGIYLGLLASLFPALIAFSIGFGFKYFTSVTVPALGVVVLSGALAGVSGGLMGFVDPQLASDWTGITATAVILMSSLWAHSQGDRLAQATPRGLTLRSLRELRLSTDLVERIDSLGQVTIHPIGEVRDHEGYPPLPEDLRAQIDGGAWKFPADLPRPELEARLEAQLAEEFDLAAVSVSIDDRGRADIAAAPTPAGLSRRVPSGERAVSVRTLLPTGLGRGDAVALALADRTVTGTVVSARSEGTTPEADATPAQAPSEVAAAETGRSSVARTTTGGWGRVTVAVDGTAAQALLRTDLAPLVVRSRGTKREFEAVGLLRGQGLRFRRFSLPDGAPFVGGTLGEAALRETHAVAVLAIERPTERVVAPGGDVELLAGDTLITVGRPGDLDAFAEVLA